MYRSNVRGTSYLFLKFSVNLKESDIYQRNSLKKFCLPSRALGNLGEYEPKSNQLCFLNVPKLRRTKSYIGKHNLLTSFTHVFSFITEGPVRTTKVFKLNFFDTIIVSLNLIHIRSVYIFFVLRTSNSKEPTWEDRAPYRNFC